MPDASDPLQLKIDDLEQGDAALESGSERLCESFVDIGRDEASMSLQKRALASPV
ncbi:MAG: hypothetical protein ACR2NU_12805 [Aeoliella sp.]